MIYDLIVVGSGSVGSAAGFYGTEAGLNVLMIDAAFPPHRGGSHHGDTRIIPARLRRRREIRADGPARPDPVGTSWRRVAALCCFIAAACSIWGRARRNLSKMPPAAR